MVLKSLKIQNEIVRSHKLKDRIYNGQKKKKHTRTNNILQNTTQKTKDRATLMFLTSRDIILFHDIMASVI